MRTKLFVASLWTLGLLFGMLAAIVLLILYSTKTIDVALVFGITIAISVITWLVSPRLTDWIQKFFYKAQYFNQAGFEAAFPQYAKFLAAECEKNRVPFPKIGFIDDDNPTAFSYGSGQWNSRIVFTRGIQTYLEEDEAEAVLAHELGHIAHRDFIVMTLANAIIQLLYEIYYVFARNRSNDRDANRLIWIGWLAYVFYWIGVYIVLFLNRLREYYADEFSAETTENPAALENALVKIAYGIMAKEDTQREARLMESTKTMGIMSLASAKSTALAVKVSNMEPDKVAKVMLYDFISPWAVLAQISATHPLTGRRLMRLEKIAASFGKPPRYNLEAARNESQLDKSRLWRGFLFGAFMYCLPFLSIVGILLVILYTWLYSSITAHTAAICFLISFPVLTILFILRLFYRYPSLNQAQLSNIYTLMTNLYANPIRGTPVQLQGEVVGRGVPGYIFGEDMMMQDQTGILYLDYEGPFPLFSNLVFALKRFKKFLGQQVTAKGWFYRSNTQFLQLKNIQGSEERVRSYPRLWGFVGSVFFALIISLIFLIPPAVSNYQASASQAGYKCSRLGNGTVCGTPEVSNKCFNVRLPADSQITRTGDCNINAVFYRSDTNGYKYQYKVDLIVRLTQTADFSSLVPKNDPTVTGTAVSTRSLSGAQAISNLPYINIIYKTNPANGEAKETWLFDSKTRLSGSGKYYYTELTYTTDTLVSSEVSNILSSLQIKSVQINQ